nr:MAG TPA: hypothetical protein [Bacteriophage sp.]
MGTGTKNLGRLLNINGQSFLLPLYVTIEFRVLHTFNQYIHIP